MTVAEAAEAYVAWQSRRWKPGTLKSSRSYFRVRIVPALGAMRIRDVGRRDVARWHAAQSANPHAADRSLALLSGLMRWAGLRGHRSEDNPCAGVRRYRVRGRERFLSDGEYRALWSALPRVRMRFGGHRDAADAVRLLAWTGCRASEIRRLRWREVRDGALHLEDAKRGPRTVWLCRAARRILAARGRGGRWVFPAPRRDGPMCYDTLRSFFHHARRRAGLEDVRLHDLRHSYASLAMRSGESVTAVAGLLGHRDQDTTARYLHTADAEAASAAQLVGKVVGGA